MSMTLTLQEPLLTQQIAMLELMVGIGDQLECASACCIKLASEIFILFSCMSNIVLRAADLQLMW